MDARKNLAIDVVALAVFAIAANPALTGVGFHEWAGLVLLAVFLAHVAVHGDWVAEAARSALRDPSWARTGNLVLDALVVVALMVCSVSGLLISGEVLRAFGLYADGYYFWGPLHATSAKVLLALLLVHVAAHAAWFARLLRKGKSDER